MATRNPRTTLIPRAFGREWRRVISLGRFSLFSFKNLPKRRDWTKRQKGSFKVNLSTAVSEFLKNPGS